MLSPVKKVRPLILMSMLAASVTAGPGELTPMRQWMDVHGRTITARYIPEKPADLPEDHVALQTRNGKIIHTRISMLSPDDRAWLSHAIDAEPVAVPIVWPADEREPVIMAEDDDAPENVAPPVKPARRPAQPPRSINPVFW